MSSQYNQSKSEQVRTIRSSSKEKLKLVAYGGKAAFQVESSETREEQKTVTFESAPKKEPNNPRVKTYNWTEKINFQATFEELPVMCAVLLGLTPSVRFDNHGNDNKYLEITNQGSNFFFKLGGKTGVHVAPVPVSLAYQFGMVVLNEYTKNFQNLSSETTLLGIRMMIKQLNDNNLVKQPSSNQRG